MSHAHVTAKTLNFVLDFYKLTFIIVYALSTGPHVYT